MQQYEPKRGWIPAHNAIFTAKWYPLMRKSHKYSRGGVPVKLIGDPLIYAFIRHLKQYCKVTIKLNGTNLNRCTRWRSYFESFSQTNDPRK